MLFCRNLPEEDTVDNRSNREEELFAQLNEVIDEWDSLIHFAINFRGLTPDNTPRTAARNDAHHAIVFEHWRKVCELRTERTRYRSLRCVFEHCAAVTKLLREELDAPNGNGCCHQSKLKT